MNANYSDESAQFKEGREARQSGTPITGNPYEQGGWQYLEWRDGWECEKENS